MNQDSKKNKDVFYELLQTQQLQDVPSFLESNIMQKIEAKKEIKTSPIKIQAIFIFAFLMSLFVLTSLAISYYFPHSSSLNDFKTLLLLGIIVQVIYELNEALPIVLSNQHLFKKFTHISMHL